MTLAWVYHPPGRFDLYDLDAPADPARATLIMSRRLGRWLVSIDGHTTVTPNPGFDAAMVLADGLLALRKVS